MGAFHVFKNELVLALHYAGELGVRWKIMEVHHIRASDTTSLDIARGATG